MGATTDSLSSIKFDMANQPGVSNLLQMLALFTNRAIGEVEQSYAGQSQYGPLKEAVAEAVVNFLKDFQSRLAQVDEHSLLTKLEASEQAMAATANQTLHKVQQAVGLRPKA